MASAVSEEQVIDIGKGKTVVIPEPLRLVDNGEDLGLEQPRVWRVLTAKDGDRRVVWDAMSIPEINSARETFNQLVSEGMVPYRVGVNGTPSSEVMSEFDPTAEEVIFMPMRAVVGG